MNPLETSYQACEDVARTSGSNFYRAFEFLRLDRRRAMTALYAFSRLADDATDGNDGSNQPWDLKAWLHWIEGLTPESQSQLVGNNPTCDKLDTIREALIDSVHRFQIPREMLQQIVLGVDMDTRPVRIERFEQLQSYMFKVASAVGLSCVAIWSEDGVPEPSTQAYQTAVDCGHAFQLTNILRDLVEDAARGRMYLADEDLHRMGFDPDHLIRLLSIPDASERRAALSNRGDWHGLMRLYTQRAKACYRSGWGVSSLIDPDAFRMFSMIWSTYHAIFLQIEKDPWAPITRRPSLNLTQKLTLYLEHAFTPWFRSSKRPESINNFRLKGERQETPRVAIIGGGLAGIQAAMHLAKHGCETWLFESRNRLGGRVGSFNEPKSQQSVDYCQHVGMKCCSELVRWIDDLGLTHQWQEQSTLYFRSNRGKPFLATAWPLPAPFHLAGLLLRWPGLKLLDRLSVAWGLSKLIRTRPDAQFQEQLAIDWLRTNRQTSHAIRCFWETILVSALGEQLPRITMGSVHKVIIDGFAATKDAYHLLVPQRSLSELVHHSSQERLESLGVKLVQGATVTGVRCNPQKNWNVDTRGNGGSTRDFPDFHSLIVAVPWHRLSSIVNRSSFTEPIDSISRLEDVQKLESAPITGVHTWWSKPWLADPHAILINRLSQWVFPGPAEPMDASHAQSAEHYYQIVISGSRDLPKGDPDAILRMVEEDLREVFPELRDSGAVLVRGKVITDPQSVFSVNSGHANARLQSDLFGQHGLFLAGDWTATGWPATMEGALRSGSNAASVALNYVGRPADVRVGDR